MPSSWSWSRRRSTSGWQAGGHFDVELVEERAGLTVLRVSGKHAEATFKDEAGGHRWQRIPPTEKRGRVQTSTITVAVLAEPTAVEVVLHERDLDFKFCRSSGNGGQNVAKTDSAVQLTHKPTGISVRCETERSQTANKETAIAVLRARIWEVTQLALDGKRAYERRQQVGSGMRGDKIRTIRVRDDVVNDHVTGKQWKFRDYERGNW